MVSQCTFIDVTVVVVVVVVVVVLSGSNIIIIQVNLTPYSLAIFEITQTLALSTSSSTFSRASFCSAYPSV